MSMGDFDLREPSIGSYAAGLESADARWARESLDISLSDEMTRGFFETLDAAYVGDLVTIPGSGDYEGWTLSGDAEKGPRHGYRLSAPSDDGEGRGPDVGMVVLGRDGTWTACHDGHNHRPGIGIGCTGTRTRHPSAEAAYRDVVVRHARHLKTFGR